MRLHRYAVKAAQAFARANGIDKVVMDAPRARLGIVTTGKSYLDVLQALEYLGTDEAACADIGIRVYKVGMTGRWNRRASRASRRAWKTSSWWRRSVPSSSAR